MICQNFSYDDTKKVVLRAGLIKINLHAAELVGENCYIPINVYMLIVTLVCMKDVKRCFSMDMLIMNVLISF